VAFSGVIAFLAKKNYYSYPNNEWLNITRWSDCRLYPLQRFAQGLDFLHGSVSARVSGSERIPVGWQLRGGEKVRDEHDAES
jgi:hypothetical protein